MANVVLQMLGKDASTRQERVLRGRNDKTLARLFSLACTAFFSLGCFATVFKVDQAIGDDDAAARDATRKTPFQTIQAAVDLAKDGDSIFVGPGTYVGRLEDPAVVSIDCAVTLEAISKDPSATLICGEEYKRCVQCASAGAIVKGFTLCDGYGTGGGFSAGGNFSNGGTVVDCVISSCQGGTGPAVNGGRAVRCRIVENVDGAVYGAVLVNCLVSQTDVEDSTGALIFSDAYNCTIVDNPGYALRRDVHLFNSVVMINGFVSAGGDDGLAATNSVFSSWNNLKAMPDDATCVINVTEPCFMAPAAGDWHPMSGSVLDGRGNAALLASLVLPRSVDRYVDLDGVAFPSKTGAVAAGAFQRLFEPQSCSGVIVFDGGISGVNGYRPRCDGGYFRSEAAYSQVQVVGYPKEGSEVVCFENPDLLGGAVFPEMDESAWVMVPPAGVVTTNMQIYASKILYVDPDGDDSADNPGTYSWRPLRTLVSALAKLDGARGVIHASEGTYAEESDGISRVKINQSYVRIKGAGAGGSVIKGQKATGAAGDDGRGEDSLRVLHAASSQIACVQGFTLEDGYSLAGDLNQPNYKGGIVYAVNSFLQVTDCELRNGWARRGSIAAGGIFKRCSVMATQASVGAAFDSSAVLSSVLVSGDSTDVLMNNPSECRQVTVCGNNRDSYSPASSASVPYNTIFGNCGNIVCAETYGCITDAETAKVTPMVPDLKFYDASQGNFRLLVTSPAMTCGVVDDEFWKAYSSDLQSRALLFVDGKPLAGALHNPVLVVCTHSESRCGIAPAAEIPLEAGEGIEIRGTTGERPAVDLTVDGRSVGSAVFTYVAPSDRYPTAPVSITAIAQTNLFVNADAQVGSDANDGFSLDSPKLTFAGLLPLISDGDTIHVAEGRYATNPIQVEATDGIMTRVLITNSNVRVVADGMPERTFIMGASASEPDEYGLGTDATRCVYVSSVQGVSIEKLTLTGGRTVNDSSQSGGTAMGAAVFAENQATRVVDCIISNNVSTWAAATRNAGLVRCRITDNKATWRRGISHGSDLYGCYIENNRVSRGDQGFVYNAKKIIGCTFGAHNYGSLTSTTIGYAIGTPSKDCPMKNCVVLCGNTQRIGGNNGNVIASHCAFANWPVEEVDYIEVGADSIRVSADCIDALGCPADENSALVDKGLNTVVQDYPEEMDSDVVGGQRVYNRTIDIGCVEFDWRPAYSASCKAQVVTATPGVKLSDGGIGIPDSETLVVRYSRDANRGKSRIHASVAGDGTLYVKLDDEEFKSVVEADGETELPFVPTAEETEFQFDFSGTGCANLQTFEGPRGMILIVR